MPDDEENPTDEHDAPSPPPPAPARRRETSPGSPLWLSPSAPPGAVPTPPAPPAGYLGAPSPPPPPFPAAAHAPQPDNGKATAALVLGIAGLALWSVSLGLIFFLNLPCSILAWRFGVQGRRRVLAGETAAGEGPAKAGVILGIVGVVLGILGLLWWVWFALRIG